MKTLIIGHRGYFAKYPENTLESLIKALEYGADGIELDVHLSKDGEVMVYHDFELSRLTNHHGSISHYTKEELQSFVLCKHHIIPTLKEVMEALNLYQQSHPQHLFYLNVELKASSRTYPNIEQKVLEATSSFDTNRIIYSSFDHHALVLIKKLNPNAQTGILTSDSMIEPWKYMHQLNANYYHPHHQFLTNDVLTDMNQHDLKINVYTVNDPIMATRLMEHGVHMIITNEVEVMVKLKQSLKTKS